MANGNFGGGTGTASDPYLVEDINDLNAIRNKSMNAYYKQVNDLNMNDNISFVNAAGWQPIGDNSSQFCGHYDGNDKKIYNLYINRPAQSCLGLFGIVMTSDNASPVIKNLTLKNVNIVAGADNVAGLIGWAGNDTGIENCNVEGIIRSNVRTGSHTGLLVGRYQSNNGGYRIKNCKVAGEVYGDSNSGGFIGNCQNANIQDCSSTAKVWANYNPTGGFIGYIAGGCYIQRCFCTGNVSGTDSTVGGFVGRVDSSAKTNIEYCFATGDVENYGRNGIIGGFVGDLGVGATSVNTAATISNCYSRGNIIFNYNSNYYVAGFAGKVNSYSAIYKCYSTGKVPSNGSGFCQSYSGVSGCIFDKETAGISSDNSGAGAKTTAEMKTKATYQALGWVI